MTHLDEGTMLAVRDGAWEAEDAALAHLAECSTCSGELRRARTRAAQVADALATLDEAVLDLEAAKTRVRARLDAARPARSRGASWARAPLAKAAGLVLLAAGAASALPGSPLRTWWRAPAAEPAPAVTTGAPQVARAGGIAVPLAAGRIAVIVRGAAPGTTIEVVWGSDATATVSAPPGSGFAYAGGRAQVDAAPGPIRLELPQTASVVTLEVDGVEYLRRSGERLDVAGPAVEQSGTGLRFVVPGR